jgi:CBS domain-containing protein
MSKRTSDHSDDSNRAQKQTKTSEWATLTLSPLSTFLKHKKALVVVKETQSLKEVMELLQKENILSVPVVENDDPSKFAFVDVLDIAGFVLATWRKLSVHLDERHFPTKEFFDTPIGVVVNFSHINKPVLIDEDKTIADAINLFKSPSTYFRLHRIGVVSAKGVLVNIISQSDIVRFAAQNLSHLENANEKLSTFSGLIRSPIMVPIDSPFSEALETLYKNKISGLALVDQEFRLSGNLSASDLRGMNSLAFDFFNGSTLQFLIKGTKATMKRTQSVVPDTTFGEVIQLLSEEKIHRAYIYTPHGFPSGFVSLIDVIVRLH